MRLPADTAPGDVTSSGEPRSRTAIFRAERARTQSLHGKRALAPMLVRRPNVVATQPVGRLHAGTAERPTAAATNEHSAGASCSRRDAVQIPLNEGLQPRANERRPVG
jgi:hypothetical protein